jgi:hypothetical protein
VARCHAAFNLERLDQLRTQYVKNLMRIIEAKLKGRKPKLEARRHGSRRTW